MMWKKLTEIWRHIPGRVPAQYAESFLAAIMSENLGRIIIGGVILVLVEFGVFATGASHSTNTYYYPISLILANILVIPLLIVLNRRKGNARYKRVVVYSVAALYLLWSSLYTWTFRSAQPGISIGISPYMLMVYGAAVFIYLEPIGSAALFSMSFGLFIVLLPFDQYDQSAILGNIWNALALNLFAWITSYVIFVFRLRTFVNQKELEQAEESLRQSNIKLKAHVKELDAFAHTVAHDLKTPLSVIVGFSDLLGEEHLSEKERQEGLDAIQRHGVKMGTIIDELLLLASIRKVGEIELEPLDMATIVAEVQDRLSGMIEEHGAEIVLPDTWPVALGRGSWVEEVWTNYLSNALKYGGTPPVVTLGATECADGWVRFWVQDNGPGLDKAQQAQLFTQFTRLHQERAKGHGLGLSIVQRIVGKLGGKVGVESTPGAGSRFWFSLRGTGVNQVNGASPT